MRTFLGSGLKDNPLLAQAMLTGVTRTAKEGIFSGLNNLNIFTVLDNEFSDKFGFTTEEVDALIKTFNLSSDADVIKEWYNGYQFGQTTIYNPWSILNCVEKKGKFKTYWSNISDNTIIKKVIIKSGASVKDSFQKLLVNAPLKVTIDQELTLPGIETKPKAIWSLLIAAGYLTCINVQGTSCTIKIPNKEIMEIFEQMMRDLIQEDTLDAQQIQLLLNALNTGNTDDLAGLLQTYLLQSMSFFDIPATNAEQIYHAFFLGLFVVLHKAFEIKSNRESGFGRYDIALIPRDASKPGIIIELKKSETDLANAATEALKQINDQQYVQELLARGIQTIQTYGIAFKGKKIAVKHTQLTA